MRMNPADSPWLLNVRMNPLAIEFAIECHCPLLIVYMVDFAILRDSLISNEICGYLGLDSCSSDEVDIELAELDDLFSNASYDCFVANNITKRV